MSIFVCHYTSRSILKQEKYTITKIIRQPTAADKYKINVLALTKKKSIQLIQQLLFELLGLLELVHTLCTTGK